MEEKVRDLPYTDEPTKVIIQELVNRKRYFQRKKMHYKFILLLAFICTLMFISNFLTTFYSGDTDSVVQTYLLFQDDKLTLVLLLMMIASFLLVKFYKVGLGEAKADYKALRLEVIQKGTDLWQEIECWQHRHQVFSKLKKDYDINLFYEND